MEAIAAADRRIGKVMANRTLIQTRRSPWIKLVLPQMEVHPATLFPVLSDRPISRFSHRFWEEPSKPKEPRRR